MTVAGFKRSMPRLLVHEGGKVDDPRDPGGRTNEGVTQRVYNGYRRQKKQQTRDVYLISPQERDAIYRKQYWDAVKGDKLPEGIDYVLFDGAVNSGPVQSIKWCQRALLDAGCYAGKIDGHLGETTISAIEQHPNHDALVNAICDRRLIFLKALKTWPAFNRGWSRRVADVRLAGLLWASGERVVPAATYAEDGEQRAQPIDAKKPLSTAPADLAAAGGAPGGGVTAEAIEKATTAIAPATGTSTTLDLIYTFLILGGVALTVGGILYGLYVRKQRKNLNDALDSETPAALGVLT